MKKNILNQYYNIIKEILDDINYTTITKKELKSKLKTKLCPLNFIITEKPNNENIKEEINKNNNGDIIEQAMMNFSKLNLDNTNDSI